MMSPRFLGATNSIFSRSKHLLVVAAPITRPRVLSTSPVSFPLKTAKPPVMSYRPNYQGGQRRGGGGPSTSGRGGRRGGRGGGGGGRGEQRWWDPVWRAERLRQQAAEVLRYWIILTCCTHLRVLAGSVWKRLRK